MRGSTASGGGEATYLFYRRGKGAKRNQKRGSKAEEGADNPSLKRKEKGGVANRWET